MSEAEVIGTVLVLYLQWLLRAVLHAKDCPAHPQIVLPLLRSDWCTEIALILAKTYACIDNFQMP